MNIKLPLLLICSALFLNFDDEAQGGYEGDVQAIEHYSAAGDTKESFKTIWYCTGLAVYKALETDNFNNHKIAFNAVPFTEVCTPETEQMLQMLGIQTGMYHGQYYPIRALKLPEHIQDSFIAYMGIPLSHFDIYVEFLGTSRQYKFNYHLKPDKADKQKIAYFRIPSGTYRYEDEYRISADVTPQRVVIRAVYNKQTLTLTLTPHLSAMDKKLISWGLKEKPVIAIQDSTAKLIDETGQ